MFLLCSRYFIAWRRDHMPDNKRRETYFHSVMANNYISYWITVPTAILEKTRDQTVCKNSGLLMLQTRNYYSQALAQHTSTILYLAIISLPVGRATVIGAASPCDRVWYATHWRDDANFHLPTVSTVNRQLSTVNRPPLPAQPVTMSLSSSTGQGRARAH